MKVLSRSILFLFLMFGLVSLISLSPAPARTVDPPRLAGITQTQLWEQTLPKVEALPLTLSVSSTTNEIVNGKNLTIKDVSFESLSWVGAAGGNLTMSGYLVLPDNHTGTLGAVPGVVLLHGLTANTNETLPWAKIHASHNYIALVYDHPGHGRSDGPPPNITNFYNHDFVDHYNETSHLYLSNCAALQAIRVLENQYGVNTSQLVIGGLSYGGINAMIAGWIYRAKIKAVLNSIAAGDFPASLLVEGKLIRLVAGGYTPQLEADYALIKEVWDPLYYVNQAGFPPMLMLCGTTDDFFDLAAFNATYTVLQSPLRAISIMPNGHHGFLLDDPTQFYWLNATLHGGPRVPQVTVLGLSAVGGPLGTRGELKFTITSTLGTVAKVEVVYSHVDLLGHYWYNLPVEVNPAGNYNFLVPTPVLNSRVMCYVRVTTTTGAIFSSPVYEVGLINWFAPLLWGLLVFAVAFLVILIIRRRMKDIRQAERAWQGEFPTNVRKKSAIDFTFLLLNGINIYLSIALTWVDFSGTTAWSGTYLFNNYFTLFGDWLVPVMLAILLIGFVLAFRFPLLVGIFDLALPVLVAVLWTSLTGMFGFMGFARPVPGPAIITMVVGTAVAFTVGIFRTRYWRPIKRLLKEQQKD